MSSLIDVPAARVEAVAALGWRGLETAHLGGWLLRAAGGFTGRANSVLPLGDPGVPVDDALAEVGRWYAERGLVAQLQVPVGLADDLDLVLERRGWALHNAARFLVSPVPALLDGPGPPDGLEVGVDPRPDDGWLAAYHYRGGTLPAHARQVLENADTLGFATLRSAADGTVLAIGRGSVERADDGVGWLGVTAVEVVPRARRRGLAGVVLRELARWADGHEAAACYLQVAEENEPALTLYGRAGFVEHHRYHYRRGPGG